MRFRLCTLLIVMALLPPVIAGIVHYRRWRDDRLWLSLESAKRERDTLLVTWRKTYDLVANGHASAADETAVQQRYFAARADVQSAITAIKARYGKTDAELLRAMASRRASE